MLKLIGCLAALLVAGVVAGLIWLARLMSDEDLESGIDYEEPAFV